MSDRFVIVAIIASMFFLAHYPPILHASSSPADTEISALRDELSRLRNAFPGFGAVEELGDRLDDIEDSLQDSPSKALEAALKVKKLLLRRLDEYLKGEIRSEGPSVKSNPTNDFNYFKRRKILVEFEKLCRAKNLSLKGLFPKGLPSRFCPPQNAGKSHYTFCDHALAYLARLFRGSSPGGGAARGGAPADSPGDDDAKHPPAVRPEHHEGANDKTAGAAKAPVPEDLARKRHWKLFSLFFTYSVYILGLTALVGIIYHFRQGASGLSELKAMAASGRAGQCPESDHGALFRESLSLFQKSKYDRALSGFETVAASSHPDRQMALYYATLALLRLDKQRAKAVSNLALLDTKSLSPDELYRLGTNFEESAMFEQALDLYRLVKEKDETFRDILNRIEVIERKLDGRERQTEDQNR